MNHTFGSRGTRQIVFRVLAGLISLFFVTFAVLWLFMGGGMRDVWAWSAPLWGVVMGAYAIKGRTSAAYEQQVFGPKRLDTDTPD